MLKKETLAYAAGLIDGEGSILLHRSKKWRTPVLSVTSTSIELLTWLKDNFGGIVRDKNEKRPNHSRAFEWRLSSSATLALLPAILPYLRERKKIERVRHILQYYTLAKAEGWRSRFEAEFYLLTGRGVSQAPSSGQV